MRRSLLNTWMLAAAGLMAAAGAAAENRIDQVRPDAPELAAYGRLSIGVRTLQFVNPGQLDIVKAKAGEPMPTYDRASGTPPCCPPTCRRGCPMDLRLASTAR